MSAGLPDLWDDCYADLHRKQSPESFKKTFCDNCLNPGCRNSKAAGTSWMNRILTQEERLLRNPLFADPNDPIFASFKDFDFKDLWSKALALEISDRKNDWTIPTESEIRHEAAVLTGLVPDSPVILTPSGFQAAPAQAPEPEPPPVDANAKSWRVSGDGKTNYEVTLSEAGVWKCPCPAFKFSPSKPCKHIETIQFRLARSNPQTTPEAPPSLPRTRHRPPPISTPLATNTRNPDGGIMVGGGSSSSLPANQPAHDPWAMPETKIAVGGRVVLGGSGTSKNNKE